MASSLDVSGWAGEVISYLDLSGVTTGSVAAWMRSNVGNLNLTIREEFSVSGSNAIVPEMSQSEIAIYSKMYECSYLTSESRRAAQLGYKDWVEIKGDDQGSIRKVSKSELSKNLISLSRICKEDFNSLVNEYITSSGNLPFQVLGLSRKCFNYGEFGGC